jgi:hypothetical protein
MVALKSAATAASSAVRLDGAMLMAGRPRLPLGQSLLLCAQSPLPLPPENMDTTTFQDMIN